VWPIQRKKNNPTKSVPEKDLRANESDKDFEISVLKMIKELKDRAPGWLSQ